MTHTGAPLRSRMALVAMVVPWTTRPVSASTTRSFSNPLRNPTVGSAGTVGDFPTSSVPVVSSYTTTSVKVPPTSTPTHLIAALRGVRLCCQDSKA
jgi:hypothetical protein